MLQVFSTASRENIKKAMSVVTLARVVIIKNLVGGQSQQFFFWMFHSDSIDNVFCCFDM